MLKRQGLSLNLLLISYSNNILEVYITNITAKIILDTPRSLADGTRPMPKIGGGTDMGVAWIVKYYFFGFNNIYDHAIEFSPILYG